MANPRRRLQRERDRGAAQDLIQRQRHEQRMQVAYLKTQENAQELTRDFIDKRVPRWAKAVAVGMYRFESAIRGFMWYVTGVLPAKWDKALTYDMKCPAPIIFLLLTPYNFLGLILSLIVVTPFRLPPWPWLKQQFVAWGFKVKNIHTRSGIRVVVWTWFWRCVLDQIVPYVNPDDVVTERHIISPLEPGVRTTESGLIIPGRG